MTHSSRLFIILAFFASASVLCTDQNRNFEEVFKDAREAAPVFIDWGVEYMHKYPAIPGIMTAAAFRMAKENVSLKRSSFVIWAALGAVVLAEPYRIFAHNYLQLKEAHANKDKRNLDWAEELKKAEENAKNTASALASAAQKGSQEAFEKVSKTIDDLTGSNDKK